MSVWADKVAEAAPQCSDLLVYCDGEYVRGRDAVVSVWDHGLLYGDGVFEGVRVYDGAFFRMHDHIRRLQQGLQSVGIPSPFSNGAEAIDICSEVVARNSLDNAHVRLIVTRGVGPPGLDPRNCAAPTVLAMAYPMPSRAIKEPISLVTSAVRRGGVASVDPRIKSLNYLASVIAKYSATYHGADDAIMLDPYGCVAEATGANVFTVREDTLCTPPTMFALEGVTRKTILELAHKAGIGTSIQALSSHELYTADELFLCGSAMELVPVASIDGRVVGGGEVGPVTEMLRKRYFECVRNRADYRTAVDH